MKVLKFGGTSLKDADAFRRVLNIIENQQETCFIVLSASAGITDKLVEINKLLPGQSEAALKIVELIRQHHIKLCNDLDISVGKILQITDTLENVVNAVARIDLLTKNTMNRILGFGEYLTTQTLFELLSSKGMKFLLHDTRDFILKNSHKNYTVQDRLDKSIQKNIKGHIFQGFICKGNDIEYETLGRGGSDLTASLLAAKYKADSLEIWTDVSGVYTADPRFFEQTQQKRFITYDAMRKMSFFGAKVLHPDTVKPAFENNIPVRILNTFNQKDKGTTIVQKSNESTQPAIVKKNNCLYYKIKIPDGVSIASIMSRIYNELENLHLEPIYSSYLDNCFISIFDENSSNSKDIMEGFNFIKDVDLTFICDIGIEKLKILTRKVEEMNILHSDVDFENNSILLVTDSKNSGNFDLNAIHKILVR